MKITLQGVFEHIGSSESISIAHPNFNVSSSMIGGSWTTGGVVVVVLVVVLVVLVVLVVVVGSR